MFDSGFLEMLIIGLIALMVVGPERLPGLASKVGKLMGKARAFVANTRQDIEKEIRAEEMRSMLSKQEEEINELRDMVKNSGKKFAGEVDNISNEVKDAGDMLSDNLKEAKASVSDNSTK